MALAINRDIMPALESLRDELAAIESVATCKIGLERSISAADYPIIRIVPTRIRPADGARRQVELLVYYGAAVDEAGDGLESVYEHLLTLERQIAERIRAVNCRFVRFEETITDEDRLTTYKLFASRFTLEI